jgi:DNA adenine methylase
VEVVEEIARLLGKRKALNDVAVRDSVTPQTLLPFLKWAGGKRWLMPLARAVRTFPVNTYVEPFLGSGAMFFSFRPARAVLSDSNVELVDTYQAIAEDWAAVLSHLRRHDQRHSREHYYRVRLMRPRTDATRAARFIYLNRTCWNGLYRVNRQGIFNTPIGTKKRAILDTDDFSEIAKSLAHAKLVAGDFEPQIDLARAGDLVFADPPYTVRHQYNGFVKYNEQLFSWADQERLCTALERAKKRGCTVICTNADHSSIRELYGSTFSIFPVDRYSSIASSGQRRGRYAEIIAVG